MNNRDERHRYGQHYTPAEVARLLAAFAVRWAGDKVFDPSCGDGRLLEESLRLKALLAPRRTRSGLAQELFGVDRSARAVGLAARTAALVARADFFDLDPGSTLRGSIRLPALFDAIIGNPPYIRQELIGAADKRRIRARLERGRLLQPEIFWPRWSGRSDIYVSFFAHSTRFLKPSGRLTFLTAGSWLDVRYGAPLREFLLRNYRVIAIIESACESFFAGASISTIITVLDREEDAGRRAANPVRFVRLTAPLGEILTPSNDSAIRLARSVEQAEEGLYRIRVVEQRELLRQIDPCSDQPEAPGSATTGWGRYLRADGVFFRMIERGNSRLRRLSDMARVRFGVKTGANDFFYLRATLKSQTSNHKSGRCAPSLIEPKYLSPVVFSLKEITGILFGPAASGTLFFNCSALREELAGTGALNYIQSGEQAGYHLRPTCRARKPWYSVCRAMKPAPLLFPSKVGERWVVALNRARAFEDKKLYGIFPRRGVSKLALAALLNSTWARYYAEITCRQMVGAQAIADIDVAVAGAILVPDPRKLPPRLKRGLEAALKTLARRPALSIFEEIKRSDRRRLDRLTLAAIGFTDLAEREAILEELYDAVTKLVRARVSKSKGR